MGWAPGGADEPTSPRRAVRRNRRIRASRWRCAAASTSDAGTAIGSARSLGVACATSHARPRHARAMGQPTARQAPARRRRLSSGQPARDRRTAAARSAGARGPARRERHRPRSKGHRMDPGPWRHRRRTLSPAAPPAPGGWARRRLPVPAFGGRRLRFQRTRPRPSLRGTGSTGLAAARLPGAVLPHRPVPPLRDVQVRAGGRRIRRHPRSCAARHDRGTRSPLGVAGPRPRGRRLAPLTAHRGRRHRRRRAPGRTARARHGQLLRW